MVSFFFFFNDTATTEIYTLSLHDALPIFPGEHRFQDRSPRSTQSIGRYRSQLNVGVLENLLNPIRDAVDLLCQTYPIPREVPKFTCRLRRHETSAKQTVLQQIKIGRAHV